jgi:thiol:disulfide interchange protein DsbC
MKQLILSVVVATFVVSAFANDTPTDATKAVDPRAAIAKQFPEAKLEDIKPSPIPGLFSIVIGGDSAYVTADGKYLITGDLYDIDAKVNLTETGRNSIRKAAIAKLDERDMIVFAPQGTAKYTINVFTDVECGYCRKLHSEIDQLNKLGVRVRYMAYPRSGPGTDDWAKMESVWCSKDRKAAITQAKLHDDVKMQKCGGTPVAKQYKLGEEFGVRGTPAIFTADGDYLSGYLPPNDMVKQLEEFKQAAAKTASRK